MVPIESWGSNTDVRIIGQPPSPKNVERLAEVRMVSPGYYDVFGIPLHAGRAPSRIDGSDAVAISYPGFFETLDRLVA